MTGLVILSINDVARIAAEAARVASPAFTITGVTVTGGSGSSGILVCNHQSPAETCQSTVGVFRDTSETALRAEIVDTLRRRLQHGPAD